MCVDEFRSRAPFAHVIDNSNNNAVVIVVTDFKCLVPTLMDGLLRTGTGVRFNLPSNGGHI